jgi:hypothetical protein
MYFHMSIHTVMASAKPKRTRTKHLVVRLNEHERAMLDVVAEHLHLPSASEAFRYLVRSAYDTARRPSAHSLVRRAPRGR